MYIILLHLQRFRLPGKICRLIVVHLRQQLRVGRCCSFKEVPSVRSLLHGRQSRQRGVVVIARLQFDIGHFLDGHREPAGIPGEVKMMTDLEAESVSLLDRQCIKVEIQYIVVSVAAEYLHPLLQQQFFILPDLQGHAVRIVFPGVFLSELHIGTGDIYFAVLCRHPHIEGILRCAGMYIILLHLQCFGLPGEISRPVAVHSRQQFCVRGAAYFIIIVSLQEPPAVGPLFHGRKICQ